LLPTPRYFILLSLGKSSPEESASEKFHLQIEKMGELKPINFSPTMEGKKLKQKLSIFCKMRVEHEF
jgi:hypothetical protein